jgi:hypothetical protein
VGNGIRKAPNVSKGHVGCWAGRCQGKWVVVGVVVEGSGAIEPPNARLYAYTSIHSLYIRVSTILKKKKLKKKGAP